MGELRQYSRVQSRQMVDYLLFESASGFALFQRTESEDVGKKLEEVQQRHRT